MFLVRRFICCFAAIAILLTATRAYSAENDFAEVKAQVAKQHEPDEYYVIASSNPKTAGFDDAVMSLRGVSLSASKIT